MSEEGSEDSPPRPKRKIKKVMVLSSDSSSDSDESVTPAGSRRKRLRVLSDDGSDSSGSSVVCATRRKRVLPKLRDSEGDSDTSGWATDHSDAPKPVASAAKSTSGFASDSSEGNSDKCSICLLRFTDQEVGTPQSCEHIFCLDCITEWSKNINTCPVDRMTFDFIVVRACAGGRVLRTEPVKVIERRPSVELLVIEDPTVCEVCGRTDNEETMLLCDGCDLGYHMQCLTPPLSEVPIEQWLCPNCDNLLSDVDLLFSGITDMDMPISSRSSLIREGRNVRSSRTHSADEPSTSSGHRGTRLNSNDVPTTSRGSRSAQDSGSRTTTSRCKTIAHTNHIRPKRRTKTVIIEYEVQENGKFPVTKRVKQKLKKRKTKRRKPRTAARRSHVLASVRAKLAAAGSRARPGAGGRPGPGARPGAGSCELPALRQRAGIPALSLLGGSHEMEYFSEDDEHGVSESASTAVAVRPTSSILSAYRQARRKMISIPSPTHASAAPDVLSSILESQTLLHSKKSVVSISVDGSVNIKLETREKTKLPTKQSDEPQKQDKIDLSQGEDAAKKAPSYPGQSRGGRGWGGGYTGNYHREQGTNNLNNRGGNYENNYNSGGYQNRQGNAFNQNNNARRDDMDTYNNYSRRPHQYPQGDDLHFDRNRRQPPEQNRGHNNQPPHQRHNEQSRYSLAPAWQPYVPPPVGPRNDPPPVQHRHSFGGFENPLDMRMGPIRRQNSANSHPEPLVATQTQQAPKPPAQPYRPLPEPPMFKFDKMPEVDKSEDEKSDSSLVIDTEKYDPTEPTNDDDSGEDEVLSAADPEPTPAPPAPSSAPAPPCPPPAPGVQDILAGLDASAMDVPPNVLDSAVRAVLHEHRALLGAPPAASDDDSEGDCPNFSIYSATSVHIANNSAELPDSPPRAPPAALAPHDSLEDLVQEDDDAPDQHDRPDQPDPPPRTDPARHAPDQAVRSKTEEEFKEKVSKRCPITTIPRNPIKIKLNTPSLIKRQVSLYDDDMEDEEEDVNVNEDTPGGDAPREKSPGQHDVQPTLADSLPKEEEASELAPDTNRIELADTDHDETDQIQEKVSMSAIETEKEATTPDIEEEPTTPTDIEASVSEDKPDDDDETMDSERAATPPPLRRASADTSSGDNDDLSGTEDNDLSLVDTLPRKGSADRNDDLLEKMTESISETEDERSYTPCLDENKSKDTSLETEKEKGIEGLDTEMISEDEGNEMFSDNERAPSEKSRSSPAKPPPDNEEGEIVDKKKEPRADDAKKKKKKDSKKEGKEKSKGKVKKGEIAFKKLSKSGKERNYRDKDKKRDRRDSSDASRDRAKQRRKERRKDLERYDVRTVVSEKRRRPKDAFGRDVSPRASPSLSRSPPRLTPARRDPSPAQRRRSASRPRRSASRPRRSPSRPRASPAPRVRRASSSPRRLRPTPSPRSVSPRAASPARIPRRRRRSTEREKRIELRRRRSTERTRKRRRSGSGSKSPRPKPTKRKKRVRSERSTSRRRSPRRRSPRRRRARRRTASRTPSPSPPHAAPLTAPHAAPDAGAASVDSRLLSPRTPPPSPSPPPPGVRRERRRRDPARHRRLREVAGPSKEVFTSGDNILVSVSFKEQERADGDERRERRRSRRRRRRRAAPPGDDAAPRPVAIIDLERSPFRELTPSPRNVIVLSDSEPGEKEPERPAPPGPSPAPEPAHAVGPKTPPSPGRGPAAAVPEAGGAEENRGPLTPPEPPDSPDAYDPYEPTRSASGSPGPASSPARCMTLETAQKTNMSADEVLDRRPLSPIEKVMALLQSTRDVSPEPPPGDAPQSAPEPGSPAPALAPPAPAAVPVAPAAPAPAPAPAPPVRIVLPSPTRSQPPKLFLAKPSPIKSDPIKPMQATKIQRPAALGPSTAAVAARRREGPEGPESDADDSPYSPGSSDFGDLFSPPPGARGFDALLDRPARRKRRNSAAKVPVKLNRKKGKTQVGVKIDEDNLKILDDLPSSAVEMQVKSKFLKKLNRQERVVEEVKLVLKPHYNKKHVTKDEYKDILRRAVPKICHNKTGEINPAKIQALVEAYVKKFRKKHKLGLV